MTFVFLTNLVNHHQIHLADELYGMLGKDYSYVAFEPLPDWLRNGGYQDIDRPYILRAYESAENFRKAEELACTADVVMIGAVSRKLVSRRQSENRVTLHYSERWFKDGYRKLLSPLAWVRFYRYHIRYRNRRSYLMCASAFAAKDAEMVFAYPGKCYKWGYFPEVPELDMEESLKERESTSVRILWVARFIGWKHPEKMVSLGRYLREKGYDFEIDMIGGGELFRRTGDLIERYGLGDRVRLLGNFPNPEVLEMMRSHHILCFTSDRNEGWGAVLNEGMANGCCPVASDEIGAVPFLVENGANGLVYDSDSTDALCRSVEYLILNPDERRRMAVNAYRTMHDVWNPANAARRLVVLAQSMLDGNIVEFDEGPCSRAQSSSGDTGPYNRWTVR